MSRTIVHIPYSDQQQADAAIRGLLLNRGFRMRADNNGLYWQKGVGFWVAPRYVKYDFYQNEILLQAWITNLGVETDLNGMVGAVPKKELKEIVQIIQLSVKP